MPSEMRKTDVVHLNWWKILLFSLPFGFRYIGHYFRTTWIHLYWIDTYKVSTTVLGLVWTIIIPIFSVYFLLFGFKTDNNKNSSKSSANNGKKRYRRRGVLILTAILTTLTWYTLLINPNDLFNINLNPALLAVYFGSVEFIHDIFWRSWSVTQNAIGVEVTSISPNDKYRIQLFGYTCVVGTVGTFIGTSVPGYLSNSLQQHYIFMMAFSIPFIMFALLSAAIIREPSINYNYSSTNANADGDGTKYKENDVDGYKSRNALQYNDQSERRVQISYHSK